MRIPTVVQVCASMVVANLRAMLTKLWGTTLMGASAHTTMSADQTTAMMVFALHLALRATLVAPSRMAATAQTTQSAVLTIAILQ